MSVSTLFANSEEGFWYDPSDLTTLWTDDGVTQAGVDDLIYRMDDKSGNGHHAKQSTEAARPTLKQDGNGNYYLDFDGTNTYMVSDTAVDLSSTDNVSVFAAATMDTTANGTVLSNLVVSNGSLEILSNVTSQHWWFLARNGGSNGIFDISDGGNAPKTSVLSMLVDASQETLMRKVFAGVDGNYSMEGRSGGGPGSANFVSATFTIGDRADNSRKLDGRIYGVIVRDTVGTGAEKQIAEDHLASKSGVTLYGGLIPGRLATQVDYDATKYDNFGLAVEASDGSIKYFGRRGTAHTGSADIYRWTYANGAWGDAELVYNSSGEVDDRNNAGGVASTGTILIFTTNYDGTSTWGDLEVLRSTDDGETFTTITLTKPTGITVASAYGPIVELPSGKLMQTFYGNDAGDPTTTYEIWALFSDDDGLTWGSESTIYSGTKKLNETACAFVSGATDGASKLVAIVRNDTATEYNHQTTSSDGGGTWAATSAFSLGGPFLSNGGTDKATEASPWLVVDGTDIYCMSANRGDGALRYLKAVAADVHTDKANWPNIDDPGSYKLEISIDQRGDNEFGYPSFFKHSEGHWVYIYGDAASASLENSTLLSNAESLIAASVSSGLLIGGPTRSVTKSITRGATEDWDWGS